MVNERARTLRKNATDTERLLWRWLRQKAGHGFKFRRQHPLGPYIVDFVCLRKRVVVELDGGHHGEGAQAAHDLRRDAWLKAQGFRVVRFWNGDVARNPIGIADQIFYLLENGE